MRNCLYPGHAYSRTNDQFVLRIQNSQHRTRRTLTHWSHQSLKGQWTVDLRRRLGRVFPGPADSTHFNSKFSSQVWRRSALHVSSGTEGTPVPAGRRYFSSGPGSTATSVASSATLASSCNPAGHAVVGVTPQQAGPTPPWQPQRKSTRPGQPLVCTRRQWHSDYQ